MSEASHERIFIGTSGWAYPSWKPGFYPAKTSAKKFLEYYATQLNSVEVNYTFRKLPSEAMLAGWLAAAGDEFQFSFKAPQRITHSRRLKDCAEEVKAFARALAPVVKAGKMGLVLYQLPPNFKADVDRLKQFLKVAGRGKLRLAFEFRHESWFCDETYAALKKYDAALCVAESDELATPDVQTAAFSCYRFRKSSYAPARLNKLAEALRGRARAGQVFAYFKHEEEPAGATYAVKTLRRMRRATR